MYGNNSFKIGHSQSSFPYNHPYTYAVQLCNFEQIPPSHVKGVLFTGTHFILYYKKRKTTTKGYNSAKVLFTLIISVF